MGVRILMTIICQLFLLFLLYRPLWRMCQDHLQVLCKNLLRIVKTAHQIMIQELQHLQVPNGLIPRQILVNNLTRIRRLPRLTRRLPRPTCPRHHHLGPRMPARLWITRCIGILPPDMPGPPPRLHANTTGPPPRLHANTSTTRRLRSPHAPRRLPRRNATQTTSHCLSRRI
jgi:hypothetical protein